LARASHRLDLICAPPDGLALPGVRPRIEGWLGAPPSTRVAGGFRAARIDDPGHRVIYANGPGGVQVSCPSCGAALARAWAAAAERWRAGGEDGLQCVACGEPLTLRGARTRPPACPGTWAIVLQEVEDAALLPAARVELEAIAPGWTEVLRRG
jgi:predicted RNA-binding Zn-ribbon protein involved in translation (DUF1610 family)